MEEGVEIVTDENTLSIISKAELDVAIVTAKQYPRSIKKFLADGLDLVTLTEKTAAECIYALPRGDKNIVGASARFAEAIASAYGNCKAGARIIGDDGEFITAQGVFMDLEKNVSITYEVKRKITNKQGKRYNADMIGVTGNACCSIALRNAILKGIPKPMWSPLYDAATEMITGDSESLPNKRAEALAYLQKFSATEEMVLAKLGVEKVEDITLEHIVLLRGLATAIKDNDTTVEQAFGPDTEDKAGGAKDVMDKFKDGKKDPAKASAKKPVEKDKKPESKGGAGNQESAGEDNYQA